MNINLTKWIDVKELISGVEEILASKSMTPIVLVETSLMVGKLKELIKSFDDKVSEKNKIDYLEKRLRENAKKLLIVEV